MKAGKYFGLILMILGAALLAAALLLVFSNQKEAESAAEASSQVMPELLAAISNGEAAPSPSPAAAEEPAALPMDVPMTEVVIDGYAYIGYLSVPTLGLELPIMADWDYTRLQIAPCRYNGTVRGSNLVLMAHNYSYHFGRLSELKEGDSIAFVDMDGETWLYEVAVLDILSPTAVEDMTDSPYELTLFTCTYGGQNRVTVRCRAVN